MKIALIILLGGFLSVVAEDFSFPSNSKDLVFFEDGLKRTIVLSDSAVIIEGTFQNVASERILIPRGIDLELDKFTQWSVLTCSISAKKLIYSDVKGYSDANVTLLLEGEVTKIPGMFVGLNGIPLGTSAIDGNQNYYIVLEKSLIFGRYMVKDFFLVNENIKEKIAQTILYRNQQLAKWFAESIKE